MRPITLSPEAYYAHHQKHFLLLGQETIDPKAAEKKINKIKTETVDGLWATLGHAKGQQLWNGEIKFSRSGNLKSYGKLSEEINALKQLHPEIKTENQAITEYFINFDEVSFSLPTFSFPLSQLEDQLQRLRLTLFLQPNEGALVFYELYDGEYGLVDDHELEYIQAEATDQANSFNRDRLNYYFNMVPPAAIRADEPDTPLTSDSLVRFDGSKKFSFVIKVLKFIREQEGKSAQEVMADMIYKINGEKRYKLLKFEPASNQFKDISTEAYTHLNPSLKTLLLIHGTFSNTKGSFGELLAQSDQGSWLQKQIKDELFEQILAFEHPTISQNAEENVRQLLLFLTGVQFPKNNPISILTTSRGGLVGKFLMQSEYIQQQLLPIEKAAFIACANGVHYFSVGEKVVKFLNIMQKSLKLKGLSIAAIITGLAEFSADFFLKLPGAQQMTIGHPSLKAILAGTPQYAQSRIQPIIGDWDKSIVQDAKLFRKWGAIGLDKLIWLAFQGDNDWVVKSENQAIMPENYANDPIFMRCFHMNYFNEARSQTADGKPSELLKSLEAFFQKNSPTT